MSRSRTLTSTKQTRHVGMAFSQSWAGERRDPSFQQPKVTPGTNRRQVPFSVLFTLHLIY